MIGNSCIERWIVVVGGEEDTVSSTPAETNCTNLAGLRVSLDSLNELLDNGARDGCIASHFFVS